MRNRWIEVELCTYIVCSIVFKESKHCRYDFSHDDKINFFYPRFGVSFLSYGAIARISKLFPLHLLNYVEGHKSQ